MKSLSFLDVLCSAVIVVIVVFQLTIGRRPSGDDRGQPQRFVAFVELTNPFYSRERPQDLMLDVYVIPEQGQPATWQTWNGQNRELDGRLVPLGHGVVIRLPKLDETRNETVRFQVHGQFAAPLHLEIQASQAITTTDEQRQLMELETLLQAQELQLRQQYANGPVSTLMRMNDDGLVLLAGAVQQVGWIWLQQNEAALGVAANSPTDLPRGSSTEVVQQRLADFYRNQLAEAWQGERKTLSRDAVMQEVALNACLACYFSGGQLKRTDLERLLDGTGEDPPSAPRYSSEAQRLYRHLYLFLHSAVLQDGRTAAERLLAPDDWQRERNDETKWSVQLPTGVGPPLLEYPLERVACLSAVVSERTPPDGALAKTGGLSVASCLAHGRLFFLMVRNFVIPCRIQSLTLHGGEITPAQNLGNIKDERMVFPLRVRIESSAPPTSPPSH
ncbi:MAG: hypothetical protein U0935_21820 [Pirellulales bacterium]